MPLYRHASRVAVARRERSVILGFSQASSLAILKINSLFVYHDEALGRDHPISYLALPLRVRMRLLQHDSISTAPSHSTPAAYVFVLTASSHSHSSHRKHAGRQANKQARRQVGRRAGTDRQAVTVTNDGATGAAAAPAGPYYAPKNFRHGCHQHRLYHRNTTHLCQ